MVMAQSLFITLQQREPDCLIDVIAPAWSVPLLRRMPQVNDAIELPIGHKQFKLLTRYRIGKQLRARHYDRAIVTPRSFKSALIPFFAHAKQRTGYRGEQRYVLLNDIRRLDKTILTQTVQRYVALASAADVVQAPPIPLPQLTVNKQNQQDVLQRLNLATDKNIVAMMPGAEYGPAKQWPVEYYRELAEKLVAKGYQVWVLGSAKEAALGDVIASGEGIYNLCGKTALVDVVDLLALARYAVTNDSGLMHIAAATGVEVIALYGSSDPKYTPPLSMRAQVMYLGLSCSPCFDRQCRFGHLNCLRDIRVDDVLEKIH
jgi:heptosyltransferase-2